MSTLYFSNWDKLKDTTSVKQAEIERAQQLSFHLFRGVGQREQSPALIAETADMRARAFTLLTSAYDNARRAVIYLRWNEGDADSIAPSLFAGRSNGRIKAAEEQPAETNTAATNAAATHAGATTPNTSASTGVNTNASVNSNSSQPNANVSAKGPFVQ